MHAGYFGMTAPLADAAGVNVCGMGWDGHGIAWHGGGRRRKKRSNSTNIECHHLHYQPLQPGKHHRTQGAECQKDKRGEATRQLRALSRTRYPVPVPFWPCSASGIRYRPPWMATSSPLLAVPTGTVQYTWMVVPRWAIGYTSGT